MLEMDSPFVDGPMGGMMFPFLFFPFMIVFVLVWFIIAIAIATWVYKDAEMRGENGVLWLIMVILTGWIGLVVWLIIRSGKLNNLSEQTSVEKKTNLKSEAPYCASCGTEISPNSLFCPNCGASVDQNW